MKKIILILLVLFQGFAFSQSGIYTMGNPSSDGTIVKWTLTLNPDGTFLYHFLRDLSATSKYSTEENFYGKGTWKLAANGQKLLFDFVENLSTPVIAAVNGFALGGGLELAMACHFRVASNTAKMGLPEVSLGVIPGYGGTQRLTQLVGKGRALELIMTASMIDANKALSYGLVNHVVPHEELLELCKTLAAKITKNSTVAISAAIKAVNANFKTGMNGYHTEITEFGNCFGTEDFKEGTTAFLEKRKAEFPGR